jgi:hypothetical protein
MKTENCAQHCKGLANTVDTEKWFNVLASGAAMNVIQLARKPRQAASY